MSVSDTLGSAAQTLAVTVYAPSSNGAGAQSPNVGVTATNPVDGASVTVSGDDGGLVVLQVGQKGGALPAGYTATTTILDAGGQVLATVQGTQPIWKFTEPGIYLAEVQLTDANGNAAGVTKLALPINTAETGAAVTTTAPASLALTSVALKGLFVFSSIKKDTVTFKGTLELPAGLDLSQAQTLSVALGNVLDTANLGTKGKAKAGTNNLLKSVSVKYPRLKKPSTKTSAGQKATVSFTLSGPNLSAQGFDAEGISQAGGVPGGAVPLTVQAALVLGGTAYRGAVPANWKLAKKGTTGQLAGKM